MSADDRAATLTARLDFAAHEELLAGFPFPHELQVTAELQLNVLSIATVLRATGDVPVPVAFGYHPYLQLPGLAREEWQISLPVCSRGLLDERGIPTGASESVVPSPGPLGARTFDDLFDELAEPALFLLSGAGRRVEVRFERGYPFAQVYAPDGQEFICFEPMTAPTNALAADDPRMPRVEPETEYRARFSIRVQDA